MFSSRSTPSLGYSLIFKITVIAWKACRFLAVTFCAAITVKLGSYPAHTMDP